MARVTLCGVAAWLILMIPALGVAGDAFTGVQIDNKSQYFAYLGIRQPLRTKSDLQPFVQFFAASLGYSFESNGQRRDARVNFIVPSLGLKQQLGSWSLVGFAGPQLRRKEEDLIPSGTGRVDEIGAYVQGEAMYWRERGSFHAIASYTELDHFFWSRLRGKLLVHRTTQGCCSSYVGWDVVGMGNKDFYAVQTGPLVEIPVKQFFFLLRGGYQYSQAFQNGAYTGLEIYTPF